MLSYAVDIEPDKYGPQGQYGYKDRPFALAKDVPCGSLPPGTQGWQ